MIDCSLVNARLNNNKIYNKYTIILEAKKALIR